MDTPGLSDSDRDDVEEKEKDSSNKEILMKIMEKVKNVSDVNELQTTYFNSYCPLKEEKKKQQDINNKNKEE